MGKFLKKGETLFRQGETGGVWRVVRGALVISQSAQGQETLTSIALPGDYIGLERLFQQKYGGQALALVDCEVQRLPSHGALSPMALMADSHRQQQHRMHDMSRLRTGPVNARLAHLLQLLARAPHERPLQRKDLPSLRDMSRLLDAASATLSREIQTLWPASGDESA